MSARKVFLLACAAFAVPAAALAGGSGFVPAGGSPLPPGYAASPAVSIANPTIQEPPPPASGALPPAQPLAAEATRPVPAPQQDAPARPPSPEDLAYQAAIRGSQPLDAEQIREFKKLLDRTQTEIARPVADPHPASKSVRLTLRPGETPPLLRLHPGNASVLTFSDATGQPWPVNSVTVGSKTNYSADPAGDKGQTNMVVVSPLSAHATANNLVVTLLKHAVPIVFTLETGEGAVDYRLDVTIDARGPNASYDAAEGSSLAPTNDPVVQGFIDDLPPKGALEMKTSMRDLEAWRYRDQLYVRTRMRLLSPPYTAASHHVSGYTVYTLEDSPVLMVSEDGRIYQVTLDR